MRKIDDKTHHRFITAIEAMIREMDGFGFSDEAEKMEISCDQLEKLYREYRLKIIDLNKLINAYYTLFDEKHSEYLNASRLRKKEHTRLRYKERKKEKRRNSIHFKEKK